MSTKGERLSSTSVHKLMKAVVLRNAKDRMQIEDIILPKPRSGEALIKNIGAGICHSDLHFIDGRVKCPMPAVFGHEVSGEIVEINCSPDTTRNLKVGDRVVAAFNMPCGACHHCENLKEDICQTVRSRQLKLGETRLFSAKEDGTVGEPIAMFYMAGFAEYSVVPITGLNKLPDSLPLLESCIIGCGMFTAYGAVKNAGLSLGGCPGADVVVLGCGGVGCNVIQVCRAFGASKIIAVDIDDDKLEFAKTMGATHIINSRTSISTVPEQVQAIVGKDKGGVDVAFEVLGNPITFNDAVLSVCDGGRAVMVGLSNNKAEVDITRLVRGKITIVGSFGAKARIDAPEIIRLIERGILSLESITKVYTLDEIATAYEDLRANRITGKAIVKI